MGGIYKEGWLWDFRVKLSFGLLQNLTSGIFVRMLDNSLHCDVIVTYDDINDKKEIIECILHHLQNGRSLHNF